MNEPKEPKKILLAGDVHGNYRFFRYLVDKAKELDCDTIVQLGDFGFWEHEPDGKEFLDNVERILVDRNLECIWIDGNHENHTLLRSRYVHKDCESGHKEVDHGFVEVRKNLWYVPRGKRWTWHGYKFLALGGAYSIDKEWRTPYRSWWPEETITRQEAEVAKEGGHVNILLTHDCPAGVTLEGANHAKHKDEYPETRVNRELLKEVFDATTPEFVFHGHWHQKHTTVLDGATVDGLACDTDPDSAWIAFHLV